MGSFHVGLVIECNYELNLYFMNHCNSSVRILQSSGEDAWLTYCTMVVAVIKNHSVW